MVAAGADPVELWPAQDDGDPEADEGRDFDYSAVDWQEGSADDWEQIQQALAETRVEVSGDRAEAADEPPVPDMGEEFDREWS